MTATTFLVGVSGCSSSQSDAQQPWAEGYAPFDEMIPNVIDDAKAGGASTSQIALLEQARKKGEVTVEMMREAVSGVSDCFEAGGGAVEPRDDVIVPGVVWPAYQVGYDESIGESTIDLLVKSCEAQEYRWISSVYQTQPTSREALGQYVLSKEGVLRDCLEGFGVPTDPAADGWELAQQAVALDDVDVTLECFAAAGISTL